jgi:hypothetical protein
VRCCVQLTTHERYCANTPCFCEKVSGNDPGSHGNDRRLAFPITEVNNKFMNQLFCKLNVKFVYTIGYLPLLSNQLLIFV